jgi:hypothetical protein
LLPPAIERGASGGGASVVVSGGSSFMFYATTALALTKPPAKTRADDEMHTTILKIACIIFRVLLGILLSERVHMRQQSQDPLAGSSCRVFIRSKVQTLLWNDRID